MHLEFLGNLGGFRQIQLLLFTKWGTARLLLPCPAYGAQGRLPPYPVPPALSPEAEGPGEAVTVQYQGHSHRISVADLPIGGPNVYDSVDGDLPILVSHTRTATGPFAAAAAGDLWTCWSDSYPGRTVVYCGAYEAPGLWSSAPVPNMTGDVAGLHPIPGGRFILNAYDDGYPDCPDTWLLIGGPDLDLPRCGQLVPRLFAPHLTR